ncbi:MAG: aspartate/glutamate racemase family protein [Pseudomonadota bacterium]
METLARNVSPVGILMLDTRFPRIPGDIGNPETFEFPVLYRTVKGAFPEQVVLRPDAGLVELFVLAGRELIREGAGSLTTSCGFMALFHRELVQALGVPVFTSSLLQVHLARAILKPDRTVGIITARKQSLTPAHLASLGIDIHDLSIVGMEDAREFTQVFIHGKQTLDVALCRREMEAAAHTLMQQTPDLGAVVLECTNMGPYSRDIRRITGVPVFDVLTLVRHAYGCVNP